MRSALLCASIAEELFIISRLSRPAGRSKRYFHGRGRNGKRQLQRRFLRKRSAAGKVPPQSLLRKASSPKGAPLGTTGNFAATAKSRPLGEGGIAAGDDGRGGHGRTNPLRLTAFASSPEGGAFCYLSVSTNKAPPSGELARRKP